MLYALFLGMSFYDGFMRPMEYMPEMAMVKTPEQSLLDELGFSGKSATCMCMLLSDFQGCVRMYCS